MQQNWATKAMMEDMPWYWSVFDPGMPMVLKICGLKY
jgi:hypothetical protein